MDQARNGETSANYNHLGTGILFTFTRGNKLFETANHLGSVNMTQTDRHTPVNSGGNVTFYRQDMQSAEDFTPFGMSMPGKVFDAGAAYSYKFNGKERMYEINGKSNQYDYGMRIYDPRGGRFWSVDPLTAKYPWYTPYQFAGNKPINSIDLDGAEELEIARMSALKRQAMLQMSVASRPQQYNQPSFISQGYARGSYEDMRPKEMVGQYQYEQSMAGAVMDPFAAGAIYPSATAVGEFSKGVVGHAHGIYQGIKEENYWKAAKNTGLLALDIAPFVAFKGAGTVEKTTESFLYRFDTRAPEEIVKAGGFKAWGSDMNLFLHAEGTNIVNKTSGYVGTSSDLTALEKVIGNQKGYIYKIKMQNSGVNVNETLGVKSPHPYEFEVAVPNQIKLSEVIGVKPHN